METGKDRVSGSIKVSLDVILKIAETAAAEIDGVARDGQRLAAAGTKAKLAGAVRARITGETAAIKLELVVLDGFNAVNVAENVQKNVKSAVQSMTGFTVTKVDVSIAGVKFSKSAEAG